MAGIEDLQFDNRFVQTLPEDAETGHFRRQVYGACHSRVWPTAAPTPRLLAFSPEMGETLGLSADDCRSEAFLEIFSGNRVLPGMAPHAACYGGHQFGQWAGQLGDGRAINLGETVTPRGQRLTLQLKGAGPTPYSRTADGFAVLRSSLREFLCSEAMHHLGVPTTRALSLILSGREVVRDLFYDGHPRQEPGAVVCRVAPSFIRFGSFEIFAARGDTETLRKLADFTIHTSFPELGPPSPAVYAVWFKEICRLTARLMVHWQRVGFVHGVMNTDNMSIHGLTLDYGPYGWLDDYDPDWTPNTTDAAGRRYRYGNQPQIAYWNLFKLANALHPLVGKVEPLEDGLSCYLQCYEQGWQDMMASKLGLLSHDETLVSRLLSLMQEAEIDMTLFYRQLASVSGDSIPAESGQLPSALISAWYAPDQLSAGFRGRMLDWLSSYTHRVRQENQVEALRISRMNAVNPLYVLRNYLAQEAIDQAELGHPERITELLDLLRYPYQPQPGKERFAAKRPEWARNRPGCSMLSCSS